MVYLVSGFAGDECVRVWLGRLRCKDRKARKVFRVFERFLCEGLDGEFNGSSPSDLVRFQEGAVGRDRYRILRLAQVWVDGLGLRVSSKRLYMSRIRSFFVHNLVELPHDPSFSFGSDVPAVDGNLNLEFFRRILLNCNPMYKAVFLMMAQGIMGEGEVVYVSNNHAKHVLRSLSKGGIFKVVLPGRKKTRNVKNFFTMLSCKGDWADAMRSYLKGLKRLPTDCLFRTQKGGCLTDFAIRQYFHNRALEAGVIKFKTPSCRVCGGETLRMRASNAIEGEYTPKKDRGKIVYVCKECGDIVWARDLENFGISNRYGVNPHEIRDLMRSRWHLSGADPLVAEFMMQHDEQVDPNHYNKFAKYEPSYPIMEYKKALGWLNVLSNDPNKVDRSEVQDQLEAHSVEVELLKKEMAHYRSLLDNPLLTDVLSRLVEQERKRRE